MASLTFWHSTMAAGKTFNIISADDNYGKKELNAVIFTSAIDSRSGINKIKSRMFGGIEKDAISIKEEDNIYQIVKNMPQKPYCVLVDEIQFFSNHHIWELSDIVDKLNIPVMCYGLRSDFKGNPFPTSALLFAICDYVEKLTTVCWCGKRATMNARSCNGKMVTEGEQVKIGDEDYISLCRRHWKKRMIKRPIKKIPK
jgi:thymidine kinase